MGACGLIQPETNTNNNRNKNTKVDACINTD